MQPASLTSGRCIVGLNRTEVPNLGLSSTISSLRMWTSRSYTAKVTVTSTSTPGCVVIFGALHKRSLFVNSGCRISKHMLPSVGRRLPRKIQFSMISNTSAKTSFRMVLSTSSSPLIRLSPKSLPYSAFFARAMPPVPTFALLASSCEFFQVRLSASEVSGNS